jgi:glycogen synthase
VDLLTPFDGENLTTANAFLVPDPWPDQMLRSLRAGLDLYEAERSNWDKLVRNAIAFQHPWKKTASSYLAMKF